VLAVSRLPSDEIPKHLRATFAAFEGLIVSETVSPTATFGKRSMSLISAEPVQTNQRLRRFTYEMQRIYATNMMTLRVQFESRSVGEGNKTILGTVQNGEDQEGNGTHS
jgi:hypothetical protein